MGLYARYIVPRLTHLAMSQEQLRPYRESVIASATGRVLEVGIGSGLNLPLYGGAVEEVVGIDISPELLAMAERAVATSRPANIRLLEGTAERLPLDDRSVDTVVVTWALCSIPDPIAALSEARRVLRPGGSLRRARAVPRPRRREMAGPPDAALDPLLGRLPPEPEAGRSPQVDGLPAHGARNRLRAWSTSDGVHVRGAGGALMGMRDRRPTTRVVD